MNKSSLLAILLIWGLNSQAQYAGYTRVSLTDNFKRSFTEATAATLSIQSDFIQEKSLTLLSEKMVSSGRFWYRKKDQLKMEYTKPFFYLLILNAGKIYIKDGQKENKFSAGSNKMFQQINRILVDCVSGNMLSNNEFQYALFENAEHYLIELRPREKNLQALYKNINIVVDKKNYTANSIDLDEVSGDQTTIRFLNKVINASIPDSEFIIP